MYKIEGWGTDPSCLPRFIPLVGSSDALIVVSILDIVWDCHLWPFRTCFVVFVETMGTFSPEDNHLQAVRKPVGYL